MNLTFDDAYRHRAFHVKVSFTPTWNTLDDRGKVAFIKDRNRILRSDIDDQYVFSGYEGAVTNYDYACAFRQIKNRIYVIYCAAQELDHVYAYLSEVR